MNPPTERTARPATDVAAGVAALLALIAVLVGIPALLVWAGLTPTLTSADLQVLAGTRPDWADDVLLRGVLPLVAWAAWLSAAIPWTLEIARHVFGLPVPRIPGFTLQQQLGAVLIGAILTGFTATHAAPPRTDELAQVTAVATTSLQAPSGAVGSTHGAAAGARLDRRYRVRTGDTLWGIASRYLRSGAAYPRIVDASSRIVQPGGRTLQEPDLILPGWTLDIPTPAIHDETDPTPDPLSTHDRPSGPVAAHPASPSYRPVASPAPTPDSSTPAAHTAAPPVPNPETAAHPSLRPNSVQPASLAVPASILAGLAAGLLALLATHRARLRRRRKHGQRIPVPSSETQAVEQQLRAVEDPLNGSHLDLALRAITSWATSHNFSVPVLIAARSTGQTLTLYLDRETDLPTPFAPHHGDRTTWTVAPATLAPQPAAQALFPALVTIGTDATGAAVLLNLEAVGALRILSPTVDLARGLLTAVVLELATNVWSRNVTILTTLEHGELARRINCERIQLVEDNQALLQTVLSQGADRRSALDSFGIEDVLTARLTGTGEGSWGPLIAIVDAAAAPKLVEALVATTANDDGLGLVVLTLGTGSDDVASSGPARIDVTSPTHATYAAAETSPLAFAPQLVTSAVETALGQLFATELHDQTPPPVAHTSIRGPNRHLESAFDELDSSVPAEAGGSNGDSVPAPYLRLLGPIDALNIPESVDMPARGIELLAYLHTRDGPASGAQVQAALWPDAYDPRSNNTRTLAKQVRNLLGASVDGDLLLPEGRRGVGFQIHPSIRSDWADLHAHVGNDIATADDDALETALRLVRGAPFTGANSRRGWWAWRAPLEEEMIATVLDIAEEFARRATSRGDRSQVRLAASIAHTVDPLSEAGYRIELRFALTLGDFDTIDRITNEIYNGLGAADPDYVLDDATQALVDQAAAAANRTRLRPDP